MRLSEYPYVVVRVACTKCSRQGRYRLARLADRYGAEIELPWLIGYLAGGCKLREGKLDVYNLCGAYFVDLEGAPRPPDAPAAMAWQPRLKAVK